MGESISSDASAMDIDSLDASHVEQPSQRRLISHQQAAAASVNGPHPGLLLGAEVPVRLLAIEDAKSEEYYRASDQIRGALDQLTPATHGVWRPSRQSGFIPQKSIKTCGRHVNMRQRPANAEAPGSTWTVTSSTTTWLIQVK